LLACLASLIPSRRAGVPAASRRRNFPARLAGRTPRLADYRGRGVPYLPEGDHAGCTEGRLPRRPVALTLLGAQVVGISPDDTASHAAFAKKYSLPFPLLADADAKVSASYGAVTNLVVAKFARRYTFLIDPQGRIAKAYLNVDTSRHSAEIIADLKRLTKP
jgi:peroxiredoxin Q/BCP